MLALHTDYSSPAPPASSDLPESNEQTQARASVKQWLARIVHAKNKWEPDFKRMRRNMEFATGLQWPGQAEIDDERYTTNLTQHFVNQKVSQLYAKNPTAIATRRERMDYSVWDGNVNSLMEAIGEAQQWHSSGLPLPVHLAALFSDYAQGRFRQRMVDKVAKTLQLTYQYQVDAHKPDFKEQMKQLVRRTITCGVAYVRPIFCTDAQDYHKLSTIETGSTKTDRVNRIRALMQDMSENGVDQTSADFQTLRSLVMSLGAGETIQTEFVLPERLEFDFPCSTSIIPDERCRHLKDFIAARWISIEYVLPVEEINAIFNVNVKTGSDGAKEVERRDEPIYNNTSRESELPAQKLVCLYEVFNKQDQTRFFVCDGWKDYVLAPEPVFPAVAGFWNHFALTFNDVEVEAGTKASIFPPSDVQNIKHPQREWNRTRDALRDHRNANAPKYIVRAGFLTDEDKEKLRSAMPNEVIELAGVPPGEPIDRFIAPMQFAQIDPRLYDTTPLEADLLRSTGMQQANLGPAQPNVTATVGTIAEQSRLDVSASNIDDLDGLLSRLAQAGGEMLLQAMSRETVMRVVGQGAVWPNMPETRADFLNEVYLQIEAASSGRPNKAVDIANVQQLAPILLQAGANPVGVVEEVARRLDDNLDLDKFFPLTPPQLSPTEGGVPPGRAGLTQPPTGPGVDTTNPQQPAPLAANF